MYYKKYKKYKKLYKMYAGSEENLHKPYFQDELEKSKSGKDDTMDIDDGQFNQLVTFDKLILENRNLIQFKVLNEILFNQNIPNLKLEPSTENYNKDCVVMVLYVCGIISRQQAERWVHTKALSLGQLFAFNIPTYITRRLIDKSLIDSTESMRVISTAIVASPLEIFLDLFEKHVVDELEIGHITIIVIPGHATLFYKDTQGNCKFLNIQSSFQDSNNVVSDNYRQYLIDNCKIKDGTIPIKQSSYRTIISSPNEGEAIPTDEIYWCIKYEFNKEIMDYASEVSSQEAASSQEASSSQEAASQEPESQTTLQDTGMGETMRNITYSHTKKKIKIK